MADQNSFDPSRYLTKVGTADYLQVMWRLVWIREVHPDAQITTELIAHDAQAQHAIFRAYVSIPGGGAASGYGSESFKDFREYIEKAETKAIGRALAALGFGTQFSAFEFGGEAEAGRIVDTGVDFSKVRRDPPPQGNAPQGTTAPQNGTAPMIRDPSSSASEKQINWIKGLAKENGFASLDPDGDWHFDEAQLKNYIGANHQEEWPNITKGLASQLIEGFKGGKIKGQPSDLFQGQLMEANNADRHTR